MRGVVGMRDVKGEEGVPPAVLGRTELAEAQEGPMVGLEGDRPPCRRSSRSVRSEVRARVLKGCSLTLERFWNRNLIRILTVFGVDFIPRSAWF